MSVGDTSDARKRRRHRRVVRPGTERFEGDGLPDGTALADDPETLRERMSKSVDDDRRILSELPPHWAKFDAEGRR